MRQGHGSRRLNAITPLDPLWREHQEHLVRRPRPGTDFGFGSVSRPPPLTRCSHMPLCQPARESIAFGAVLRRDRVSESARGAAYTRRAEVVDLSASTRCATPRPVLGGTPTGDRLDGRSAASSFPALRVQVGMPSTRPGAVQRDGPEAVTERGRGSFHRPSAGRSVRRRDIHRFRSRPLPDLGRRRLARASYSPLDADRTDAPD